MIDDRFAQLAAACLYLVCGDLSDERLDGALRGGVQLVQLRIKSQDDDRVLSAARRLGSVCRRHGVPLILNDRPDLVAPADADGVHVGQDDLPVAQARRLVGPGRIVGLSTHSPAQVEAANEAGVDYIGVGPVNATPTKPGRPAVGTQLVAYAAQHARMPFFAIGGIDAGNVARALEAGARRVAVVRAIAAADDPAEAARSLRAAMNMKMEMEVGLGAA